MKFRLTVLAVILPLAFACGETPGDASLSIEQLEPVRGPLAGGNVVVLSGAGLDTDALRVTFAGAEAPIIGVLQDGRLQVTAPASEAVGLVDVLVTAGDTSAYAANAYSYNPLPTITSVVPDRGRFLGAALSIVGTGFTDLEAGDTTVRIGDELCLDISVQSDTVIVCNAPEGTPWTLADVKIENANGEDRADDAFGYMKDGLFVADGRGGIDGNLYFVDTENSSYEPIARLDEAITGLASHLDGTLYGVTSNAGAVFAGYPRSLVEINPFTGEVTPIGQLLTSDSASLKLPDIAMAGDTGVLYGWSKTQRQLVTVALDTGRVTLLGGDTNVNGSGLAFDLNANLFLSPDGSNGELFDVDRANGALSNGTSMLDDQGDDISALTFEGTTMYGVREGVSTDGATIATVLLQIDPETGVVQELFDLPFGADALTNTPPVPFK